jgi:hypothetical protein
MNTNVVMMGWDRPIPGREKLSAQHFQDFGQFLGGLQQKGAIQAFEVVLLDFHGGDMNGFFLIRGESPQLDSLLSSSEWQTHMTRAGLHLERLGVVRGATGDLINNWMQLWGSLIPA